MPSTTPLQAWPIPSGGDAPSSTSALATLGAAVEKQALMRFPTDTARDAAIAAGTRVAGMVAYIDSYGYFTTVKVNGGPWSRLAAEDLFPGGDTALKGNSPGAGVPKIRKEFSDVLTTATFGGFNAPFHGGPFPNGITSLVMTPGDNAGSLGFLLPVLANVQLSSYNGVAYTLAGNNMASGLAIRVNILALGW